MQWGQIKTLFILCFLILNIFLLHHFINNPTRELEYTEDMPREENVRNNVSGLDNIPEETPEKESMLHAQRMEFTEEDVTEIIGLPNQNNVIIDDHLIVSQLESPLAINVEEDTETLSEHVWNLDKYEYFGKDEQTNTHIFFQKIDRPIYFNLSGVLLIQENQQNEVIYYVQTILEKAEEQTEQEEEINKPFDALTGLYFSDGNIVSGDEITKKVALGYHNLLPLPNGVQVLAPTWEFEVNEEEFFYVNAVESHYTMREKHAFIVEMKEQIEEYFGEGNSSAVIAPEDWEEGDLDRLLEQLLENIEQTNGVE
ncbi:two-component system regulatory protein YycI [Gracilibacillus kekensis]|uniref:Two-component signal transduction system YycFG, regulatory protein YycI n=1 Tax=Gracilibacillus kekensis TaxID=1027249 RepID=A0A1M7QQ67_9BACI|nr:two-component system regulatory protein YycI [Gracilibacillus kekensis]SHN33597.1 Two-component signal transduction system YycFG, regulatory protein YycI [Gracilibacillus kekensis]